MFRKGGRKETSTTDDRAVIDARTGSSIRGRKEPKVELDYDPKDLKLATRQADYAQVLAEEGDIHRAAAKVLGRKYTPPESE